MEAGLTTAEAAKRLSGELLGAGDVLLRGVNTLAKAVDGDLSWLGSARMADGLKTTKASAVLVAGDDLSSNGPVLIRVADPDAAMLQVSLWFAPPPRTIATGVHPTAWVADDAVVDGAAIGPHCSVESGARVEPGAQLWAGVRIGQNARVGKDSILRENVVIGDRCELGARVSIFPNATIGADGFGFLFRDGRLHRIPQIGNVVIEDDVEIGANACVDRGRLGTTRVGRGTKIDNLVQVAHNCEIGPSCILAGQTGLAGSAVLEAGVITGGQVGVVDHIRIGSGARIAAQSAVMNEITEPGDYRGTPAVSMGAKNRQLVAVRKLPDALKELKDLKQRVQELESAAHDPTRS